jgi:hypothetical protein
MTEPPAPELKGRRGSVARPAAVGLGTLGLPGAVCAFHPLLAAALAIVEAVVVLVFLFTALFGSETISDRGFRLLRWIANQPEPAAPPPRPVRETVPPEPAAPGPKP